MRDLQRKILASFGGVPFEADALREALSGYEAVNMKLSRMVAEGELIRLKRGLFCAAPGRMGNGEGTSLGVIANRLYGPSYVSYETALSLYGLIPERVVMQLSAVGKRGKAFDTPFGRFKYVQTNGELFPLGVRIEKTAAGNYLMANRTKALCDTLMRKANLRIASPEALYSFLEDDMRFDFDEFGEPDFETLRGFSESGIKPGLFKALERMFR